MRRSERSVLAWVVASRLPHVWFRATARVGHVSGVLLRVFVRLVCVLTAVVSLLGLAQPASATVSTHTYATITAKLELGQTGHVTGSVSPARPGKTVTLQRLVGSSWQNRASVALSSTSHFSFAFKPTVKGSYYYRVVKPAESGYAGSVSSRLTTTVYAKVRYLETTYSSVGDDGGWTSADQDVTTTSNGTNFPHSLGWSLNSCERCGVVYEEYAIGGTWGVFAATVGLQDDSPTGATAKLEVFMDGRSTGVTLLQLGQTTRIRYGTSHIQRIRIQVTVASAAHISIGSPILSSDPYSTTTAMPVAAYLSDLDTVAGGSGWSYFDGTRELAILGGDYRGNGIGFRASDGCGNQCGSEYYEWSLGRKYRHMTLKVGLDDGCGAQPGSATITGDGVTLWSGAMTSTSFPSLNLDVTNVLRLHIEVNGYGGTCSEFADVRLYA